MTAISGLKLRQDLIGKACRQPVYRLLGGGTRAARYANGWYGAQHAARVCRAGPRGRRPSVSAPSSTRSAPRGRTWLLKMPTRQDRVAAVREAVGLTSG
jgi:L-alanine-DL-glutamate epimerase-like enolase superfamily enzyme